MKKILLLAVLLLSVSVAYANELSVSTTKNQISPYGTAEFLLTVENGMSKKDTYTISADDIWWSLTTDPLKDYTVGFEIPAKSTATTRLFMKPREEIPFGSYNVEIILTSQATKQELKEVVEISVREDLMDSPIDVEAALVLPEYLDPRRTSSVKVQLTNNYRNSIEGLVVNIKSKFFDKTAVINLGPTQSKAIDFPVTLNEKLQPQTDTITAELIYNDEIVKTIKKEYKISPYAGFEVSTVTEDRFMGSLTTYTFINDGNAELTDEIMIETGFFRRVFTSTNPDTESISKNGVYYLVREITLLPGESYVVNEKVDYKPILYLIILIIAAVILYYVFRAPVIVAKEASDIIIDEGGINSVKVVVRLKNRSNRSISHIKIIDRIPRIAAVEKQSSETLQPSKIYPYADGTAINWIIPKLDPGEVRIITYKIKTKLGVVGELRLKPVIVQYGRKKTYSNPVDAVSP